MRGTNVYDWMQQKQQSQSTNAIFLDAWFAIYGRQCASNKTEIDARTYDQRRVVPEYLMEFFSKETGCCIH